MGAAELAYEQDRRSIQSDFDGPRTIAFINPKGGAAKTTGVLAAGYTFGTVRGGGVVAWDNNETRGTLGIRGTRSTHRNTTARAAGGPRAVHRRLPVPDRRPRRVRALAGRRPLRRARLRRAARRHRQIRAEDFNAVHQLLERFYRVILVDTGNNMRAENWLAAADAADLLVVTSTVREDTGYSGLWMLDALQDAGYQNLKHKTVTVLSDPSAPGRQQAGRTTWSRSTSSAPVASTACPTTRRWSPARWCPTPSSPRAPGWAGCGPARGWPRALLGAGTGHARSRLHRDRSVLRAEVVDRDLPEPGPGEVRVRLVRAGVNPTDWKFRAGMMRGLRRGHARPGRRRGGRRRRRRASTGSRSASGSGWCWPSTGARTAPPPSTPSSRSTTSCRCPTAPSSTWARARRPGRDGAPGADRAEGGPARLGPGDLDGCGAGGRGSGRGRQRRDPAGPLVRRHGGHHRQQRGEGGARAGRRRAPRRELPRGRRRRRRSRRSHRTASTSRSRSRPAQNNELDLEVRKVHGTGRDLRQQRRRRADHAAAADVLEEPPLPVPHPLHARRRELRAGRRRGRLRGGRARARCGSARRPACPCTTSRWTQTAAAHDAVEAARSARCCSICRRLTAHWSRDRRDVTGVPRVGTYRWRRRSLAALVGTAVGEATYSAFPKRLEPASGLGDLPRLPEPQRERLLEMAVDLEVLAGGRVVNRSVGRRHAGLPALGHPLRPLHPHPAHRRLWGFVWIAVILSRGRTGSATRSTPGATSGRSPPPDPASSALLLGSNDDSAWLEDGDRRYCSSVTPTRHGLDDVSAETDESAR